VRALAETIIGMARALGVLAVAEGSETPTQLPALARRE
jgi:EAL domain-containing protein (putative c-di-GMP-specific phosphodiesterase class I)